VISSKDSSNHGVSDNNQNSQLSSWASINSFVILSNGVRMIHFTSHSSKGFERLEVKL
jgi:hypothetical protein